MVGASALSPSDAARQEAVVGSAQHIVVTRARAPRDTAVQHYLDYFGFQHPDLELEGILPETAPRVAYAPIDLDGQVRVVVDVPPEVYEIVRLLVYLPGSLDAESESGIQHPLVRKHMISVLASETVRPNAAHTVTITSIIFVICSGNFETTPASPA